MTDHQRLSGAGYCFSASAPPFTCATAKAALDAMTPARLTALRARGEQARQAVEAMDHVTAVNEANTPVVHVRLTDSQLSYKQARAKLDAVARKVRALLTTRERCGDMALTFVLLASVWRKVC